MARLDWTNAFRNYDVGVDRGVLYFGQNEAITWDGLVSVNEEGQTSSARSLYFEGVLANVQQEASNFKATVQAFTYPYFLESAVLGLMDTRTISNHKEDDEPFGFTYRTMRADGYVIHLVYNVVATIDGMKYETLSQDIDLEPFEFTFHTTPVVDIEGAKPTSHFMIDTARAKEETVFEVERLLYGSDTSSPRLPTISAIIDIFKANA
jgi:hypothetical protein